VIPDEWLNDARLAGRDVVGLLKNTPFWASEIQMLGAPPYGLDLPVDDPDNYWAAFVRRTVQYYGEKWGIHHWIIYNEPDIRPGEMGWYEFDGEVQDYYYMLKVAYLAAKSVDPDVVIHLSGMAWWVDVSAGRTFYLERLLDFAWSDSEAHKNGFFFDVVMVHVYYGTQSVWDLIDGTRTILVKFGLHDKSIWVDETNARPSFDPFAEVPEAAFSVSLSQQADFIVHAAAMSMAAGVERFGVYRLYDNHYTPGVTEPWGLVRGDGSRRPAFEAYRTVIRTFTNTIRTRRYYSDRSSMVTLEQSDQTVYVMWARGTDPVRFHVGAFDPDETATQVSVYGATSEVEHEIVPGVEGRWYVLEAPGALLDECGWVIVEGSPVILVAAGPPRAVWIQVQGAQWRLR
jgi:hypothetical protein